MTDAIIADSNNKNNIKIDQTLQNSSDIQQLYFLRRERSKGILIERKQFNKIVIDIALCLLSALENLIDMFFEYDGRKNIKSKKSNITGTVTSFP